MHPISGQRIGVAIFFVGILGILAAALTGAGIGFIVASVVAGFGQGLIFAHTMRRLLPPTPAHETAGLLAVVYAISYLGAAIPALIAGQLSRLLPLIDITAGYGVLALLAVILTLVATRRHSWSIWFNPSVA